MNGIAYLHLGYIKPRPNHMIMPWVSSGVLENPLSLNVLNLETIPQPTREIVLVNHNNYKISELQDFVAKFNGEYSNDRRIVSIINDDRVLQCLRCVVLN